MNYSHCSFNNARKHCMMYINQVFVHSPTSTIQSLPRPKIDDQFHHISLDLARFTTMTLQIFPWEDTIKFLSQESENFGMSWAKMFKALGGNSIFSRSEQ